MACRVRGWDADAFPPGGCYRGSRERGLGSEHACRREEERAKIPSFNFSFLLNYKPPILTLFVHVDLGEHKRKGRFCALSPAPSWAPSSVLGPPAPSSIPPAQGCCRRWGPSAGCQAGAERGIRGRGGRVCCTVLLGLGPSSTAVAALARNYPPKNLHSEKLMNAQQSQTSTKSSILLGPRGNFPLQQWRPHFSRASFWFAGQSVLAAPAESGRGCCKCPPTLIMLYKVLTSLLKK